MNYKFFTFSNEAKIRLQVKFAVERVAEVNILINNGEKVESKAITKAKTLLLANVVKAAEIIQKEKTNGKDIALLSKETDDQFDQQEKLLIETFQKALKESNQQGIKTKEKILQQAQQAVDNEQINLFQSQIEQLKNEEKKLKQAKDQIKQELRVEKKNIEQEMSKDDQIKDREEQKEQDELEAVKEPEAEDDR